LTWDPHLSVIRWAWAQHGKYRSRFASAVASEELSHLRFVRVRSRREAEAFLAQQRGQ
jgi:hypothetical protein